MAVIAQEDSSIAGWIYPKINELTSDEEHEYAFRELEQDKKDIDYFIPENAFYQIGYDCAAKTIKISLGFLFFRAFKEN